nr:uncharacterized protein, mitochondrial [Quercus suber]
MMGTTCFVCVRSIFKVMGRIHAILSDGTIVTDVEAFRRLYEQVGLGWVYAITKYEPIATITNAIYGVWAKYRLQITVTKCTILQQHKCIF